MSPNIFIHFLTLRRQKHFVRGQSLIISETVYRILLADRRRNGRQWRMELCQTRRGKNVLDTKAKETKP